MNHVREIAKKIVAEMEGTVNDHSPKEAHHYRRLAIIDYAEALRHSRERTPEHNERLIEQAYIHYYKAIQLGVREDGLEATFSGLRSYWSKKLMEAK